MRVSLPVATECETSAQLSRKILAAGLPQLNPAIKPVIGGDTVSSRQCCSQAKPPRDPARENIALAPATAAHCMAQGIQEGSFASHDHEVDEQACKATRGLSHWPISNLQLTTRCYRSRAGMHADELLDRGGAGPRVPGTGPALSARPGCALQLDLENLCALQFRFGCWGRCGCRGAGPGSSGPATLPHQTLQNLHRARRVSGLHRRNRGVLGECQSARHWTTWLSKRTLQLHSMKRCPLSAMQKHPRRVDRRHTCVQGSKGT